MSETIQQLVKIWVQWIYSFFTVANTSVGYSKLFHKVSNFRGFQRWHYYYMHILLGKKKKTNCHLITYKYALNNLFELAFHCTGGQSCRKQGQWREISRLQLCCVRVTGFSQSLTSDICVG